MHPRPHVLTQTIIAVPLDALVLLFCGGVAGPGIVIFGTAAFGWAVLALQYHVRRSRHAPSGERTHDDLEMAALGVAAIGIPLATCIVLVTQGGFDGLLFSSAAASVAGSLVFGITAAVLLSSAADWYLITPFQRGILNPPICRAHAQLDAITVRRRYAKWWVAHRGLCELVSYSCFAIFLTIVFAAVTELVDADSVLQVALGSFIGAGTAFALVSYLVPRVKAAWEYMQVQSAGLGMWASGMNARGESVEGLFVDISLKPGLQLRPGVGEPVVFVPLANADSVQECDAPSERCAGRCEFWIADCDVGVRERELSADS